MHLLGRSAPDFEEDRSGPECDMDQRCKPLVPPGNLWHSDGQLPISFKDGDI